MKTFNLSNGYEIVCDWKKTRTAFKHVATILKNGAQVYETKICYLNRTWESYEFQDIIHKAIRNYFNGKEVQDALIKAVDSGDTQDGGLLKSVALIAKLGDLLCDKPEEKNQWKKKFISKVGGIDFPEDFDNLPEAEKQRRLDGAIEIGLGKKNSKK